MIYGIYARVSTEDQNVEQQVKILKDYAKKNNLYIRTYQDFGVSGKVSDRPGWNCLLKDIGKGKIKGLIVSKYDRITRELKYAIKFLEFWDKHKFKLLSIYDGEFMGTPDHIFSFKLKCLLSEYELQQLRWRSRIGIDRAMQQGKYKGRKKGSKNKK